MADEGCTNRQTPDRLNTRTARISKWRQRFAGQRLQGLHDAARSGDPAKYDESTEKRILALLDEKPPKGYSQWNGGLLAEKLGDVSKAQVSGGFCAGATSVCNDEEVGASAQTLNSAPKPQPLWVCI
jgi:hypothetical protein